MSQVARVRADLRKAQKAATAAAENGGPLGRAHRLVQEASDQLSHLQGQVDSAEASVKEQTGARQRAQQALEVSAPSVHVLGPRSHIQHGQCASPFCRGHGVLRALCILCTNASVSVSFAGTHG